MAKLEENRIRISVRNMVEFLLRSGDIDSRRRGKKELEAMAAGARIHRKLQKQKGFPFCAPFRKAKNPGDARNRCD